jgi:hypothetical protein
LTTDGSSGEGGREIYGQAPIFTPIFIDPYIFYAPLKMVKSALAKLAPVRINREQTDQMPNEASSARAPYESVETLGTNRQGHWTITVVGRGKNNISRADRYCEPTHFLQHLPLHRRVAIAGPADGLA